MKQKSFIFPCTGKKMRPVNVFFALFLTVVSLNFFSCTGDEPLSALNFADGNVLQLGVALRQTRATDTAFEQMDKIGVYAVRWQNEMMPGQLYSGGNYADNTCYALMDSVSNNWTSDTAVFYPSDGQKLDLYAYYPYRQKPFNPGMTTINLTVAADQRTHEAYTASDFVVAKASGVTRGGGKAMLTFDHRLSQMVFELKPGVGFTAADMTGAAITVKNALVDGTFDLTAGNAGIPMAGMTRMDVKPFGMWMINTDPMNPKLTGMKAIVMPQQLDNNTYIEITLGTRRFTKKFPEILTLNSGESRLFTLTVNNSGVDLSTQFNPWVNGTPVDGIVTEEGGNTPTMKMTMLTAPDGKAGDGFGNDIAVSENFLIIGTLEGKAAYVYKKTFNGWEFQTKIVAPVSEISFGTVVRVDGDYVAIAAPKASLVYIYKQIGGTWIKQDCISDFSEIGFGSEICLNGDCLIVGNPQKTVGENLLQGTVSFYKRNGEKWEQDGETLVTLDGESYDNFGGKILMEQNMIFISAFGKKINSSSSQGCIYFYKNVGNSWMKQQTLTSSFSGNFGTDIQFFNNHLFITGNTESSENLSQGCIYTYSQVLENWELQGIPLFGSHGEDEGLLINLAVGNDYAVVGAPFHKINYTQQGAAYIYKHSQGINWNIKGEMLFLEDGQYGDDFGGHVAISNNTAFVSAASKTIGVNQRQGAVYIYEW